MHIHAKKGILSSTLHKTDEYLILHMIKHQTLLFN